MQAISIIFVGMDALDSINKKLDRFFIGLEELKKSQDRTDAQLAKTDAQLAKTDAQLAKTDAQLAKTDAQLAKTDAQLARTDARLSNIGINLGHTAEEFFYYSLEANPTMGKIRFDEVKANIHSRNKKTEDEFDIVLYNGDSIGIVEIKHKVHPNDIEKLCTKKVENFRLLFPDYQDYKIYLGIGGMSIPIDVADMAKSKGVAVIRQKGELMQIDGEVLEAY